MLDLREICAEAMLEESSLCKRFTKKKKSFTLFFSHSGNVVPTVLDVGPQRLKLLDFDNLPSFPLVTLCSPQDQF